MERTRLERLPHKVQQQIIDRKLKLFIIDASRVALDLGLGARSNTILQTCFFALSGVLPRETAIAAIKKATEKTYARKGAEVVKKNFAAIDNALANLREVQVPGAATSTRDMFKMVPDTAPAFVRKVTAIMLEGRGDTLP
jgi:pyruvate-ferredoxin/flavodoxin oxidoreductase